MRTKILKSRALHGVLGFGACALALAAEGHYQFLSVENDEYAVELVRWERHGEQHAKVRFGLLVTDRSTGEQDRVEIDNLLTEITRLEIADRMLLAAGDVQGMAQGVTVVRLATPEVTDFILSYGFELSPSERYLVFRKFYPPRGMAAGQSDVVMIYDLSQERAANWLEGSPGSPAGQAVGIPVYPLENVSPPSYRVWVPEPSQRHYVDPKAGFLWGADEKSLFFIDRTEGQTHLVRVDLAEGLLHPRIGAVPIDVKPVIAAEAQSAEYPEALERAQEGLAVTGLRMEPNGRITLELDSDLYRRKIYQVTELTVAPPEAAAPNEATVEESPQ